MKKIIRYTANALGRNDELCRQLGLSIVYNLQHDVELDKEFRYSNQVFLDCIRAALLETDYRLNNKIQKYIEVTIYGSTYLI